MASMNKCFNSMCIKQMHHWSIPTWAAFQVLWVVDARAAMSFNISTQKVPKSVHEHLCCTLSYPFISSKYKNLTTFLQLLLAVCHLFDTGFLPKKRETGKPGNQPSSRSRTRQLEQSQLSSNFFVQIQPQTVSITIQRGTPKNTGRSSPWNWWVYSL